MRKTVLITGATDGIGKHLAKKLASEGHDVLIHGRNPQKLSGTLAEIQALTNGNHVAAYQADFAHMSEVYQFVADIQQDVDKMDVLLNNAGLYGGSDRRATAENTELTFMLSVQVPYILATELRSVLEQATAGRIINTASFMHHFANPKQLDFGCEQQYSPGLAYNNAKLYTIWLTRYLAQQFREQGSSVIINSYHPGLIATNLGNDSSDERVKNSLFGRLMKAFAKNLDEGIETGYHLALSETVTEVSGAYFDNKKIKRASSKGYTAEKAQQLIAYCDRQIERYRKDAGNGESTAASNDVAERITLA